MINIYLLFIIFSLSFLFPIRAATINTAGASADKTIYENINSIPELSYASGALNASFALDIAAVIADCANVIVSRENVNAYTMFVPTNDALKEAFMFYHQRPDSDDVDVSSEQQQKTIMNQVLTTGKIDLDAIGLTDIQKQKLRAELLYSIIPGECTDADLNNPVQFLPTLLQPKINIQVTQDPQQAALKRKSSAGLGAAAMKNSAMDSGNAKLSDRTKSILRSLSTDFSNEVKIGDDESQRLQIINLNAAGDLSSVIAYQTSGVQYKNASIAVQFPAQAAPQTIQPPTAPRPPADRQSSRQMPDSDRRSMPISSGRGLFAEDFTDKLKAQEQRGLLQSNVIAANIRSSNGILHIIDRIILPPLNTTLHLKLAGLQQTLKVLDRLPTIKNQMNNKQQMTFFAPSEQAWKDFITRYQDLVKKRSNDQIDDDQSRPAPVKQPKKVQKPYQNLDEDSPSISVAELFTDEQMSAIINSHLAFDVVLYSSAIGRYQPENDNFDLSTRSAIRSLAKAKTTPAAEPLKLPVRKERQAFGSIITAVDGVQHSVRKASRGFVIDDASIIYPNIVTKNGVVHVINKFLISPQQLMQLPIRRELLKPSTPVDIGEKKKIQPPSIPQRPGNLSISAGQTCLNVTAIALLPTLRPPSPSPPLQCPEGDQICYVLDITQPCETEMGVGRPSKDGEDTPDENRLSAKCPPLLIGSRQRSRSYSRSVSAKSFRLFAQSSSTANITDQVQLNYVARCYSPQTHVCVNNHFLCPLHASSLCGNQCYDPTKYRCYTSFSLCPASATSFCFGACYDKNLFTCTTDGLQEKKKK